MEIEFFKPKRTIYFNRSEKKWFIWYDTESSGSDHQLHLIK